jgi:cyanophycinase
VTARRFALLGSGEFEPWSEVVDAWALERAAGDGSVLVVPTASAPEGDAVFDGWATKGLAHFGRRGTPAAVVSLKTREDASNGALLAPLARASVVYVSGGNPSYLAATLADTPFWRALLEATDRGLVYVGCSAGVACLTEDTYDSAVEDFSDAERLYKPGLGLVRDLMFGPHWDMVDEWIPGARGFILAAVAAERTFVGIDERTAMVGDGSSWDVLGEAGVHVRERGAWRDHPAGSSFTLPFRTGRERG